MPTSASKQARRKMSGIANSALLASVSLMSEPVLLKDSKKTPG
jgi:hypothetical protein